ncbi:hypothetical protein [Olivibacter sp. XZL3]|uniref:hypothetical protein n=1 Tax=Olivibacter sp. XZL3 TaxID=1735116 RepID=UPI001065B0D1|nr:hypothetical protein [Olivibacter sp. XZL3]
MHLAKELPSYLTTERLADCPAFFRFLTRVPISGFPELYAQTYLTFKRSGGYGLHTGLGKKPISHLVVHE